MAKVTVLNMNVHLKEPAQLASAVETLSRVATGLAMEGMQISLSVSNYEEEEDDG